MWVRAGRPRQHDHPIRQAYKVAKRQFRSRLRLHRKTVNDEFFASLDSHCFDSRRLFQTIRGHVSSVPHTTSLHFNDEHYEGDNILDGWANYFDSLGAPSNSPMDSNHIHILNVFQSLSTLPSDDPDVFVEDEEAAVIKSLPLRKSAGPDHITYEHLIYAGPILPKVLTILFNTILCSAYIPSTFKHGYVVPLPKSHNKPLDDPSNYRGISLLSCISKLFEKLLLLHLGDVQKSLKNIPSHLWHLLNSWYHQITSSVIWNADISRPFPIHQGVRQGAILSPLLYSVFVDELLDILSSSGHGVFIDDIFCGAPMYADAGLY